MRQAGRELQVPVRLRLLLLSPARTAAKCCWQTEHKKKWSANALSPVGGEHRSQGQHLNPINPFFIFLIHVYSAPWISSWAGAAWLASPAAGNLRVQPHTAGQDHTQTHCKMQKYVPTL